MSKRSLALILLLVAWAGCLGAGQYRPAEGAPARQAPPPPPPPPPQAESGGSTTAALRASRSSDANLLASNGPVLAGLQPGPPGARPGPRAQQQQPPAVAPEALLVYTATIEMAVFEVVQQVARVEDIARGLSGFLARRTDNSITIRVPAPRFAEAMQRITQLGDVLHREVNVEDVTEQFRDLEVRLKNARQVRDRLAELLARAQGVKDALEIQKEMARVTEDIERFEGRLRYLRDRAQLSTITVSFQQRATEQVDAQVRLPFPWLRTLGLSRLLNLR